MASPAYRSLVAWQRADDLFVRVHRVVQSSFPRDERYVLCDQVRRAALSVPANIVEGIARVHTKERLQFLRIAWGSLQEVGYFVHVAHRLHYLSDDALQSIEDDIRQVAAPLRGLIKREGGDQ